MVNGNIDLCFNDHIIPSLVDTGATISCIRDSLAHTLSKQVPHEFTRVRARVYLADGALCHITKKIKLKLKIKNRTFSHQFAILPKLTQPIVLGTDFLSKTKSIISYSNDPTPKSQPIRAVRAVTIPPFSEIAINGQVTCYHSVAQINGVTDNLERHLKTSQYIVQHSVVTPNDKDRHPIILFNITSRPCTVRKGEIVGLFTKTDIDHDSQTINTTYEDPDLTDIQTTDTTSDTDFHSNADSDATFYIPTPNYSTCSESDNEDTMSDEEIFINTMNEENDEPTTTDIETETETNTQPFYPKPPVTHRPTV